MVYWYVAIQVRVLQQADDDATLTQLVIAWVHLAQGGKRYQEASYIFDELIDKFQVRIEEKKAQKKKHERAYEGTIGFESAFSGACLQRCVAPSLIQ